MTIPPGKYLVLYDGLCRFCTRQSRRLARLARQGRVETVDFQVPGALTRFPGITHEACMKAMHLVAPDGQVYRGFEAVVRALTTRPAFAWVAPIYYLPGLRHLLDGLYAFIAANRYRFWGQAPTRGNCAGNTCRLHGWRK